MYCVRCDQSIEEMGGTQLEGCSHFFCSSCIVDLTDCAVSKGLLCTKKGCNGIVAHKDLEFLVPGTVHSMYIKRVAELAKIEDSSSTDDDDFLNDDNPVELKNDGAPATQKSSSKSAARAQQVVTFPGNGYDWVYKACFAAFLFCIVVLFADLWDRVPLLPGPTRKSYK